MRWRALALSCFMACSTDTFTGDDGGGDGGDGGSSDATLTDVIKSDVTVGETGGGEASANCFFGGGSPNCGGGSWCSGETCCASDGGAQCTNNACNGASFACRNTVDCTSTTDAGGFQCCLNLTGTIASDVCPRPIKGTGQAACATTCSGYKLCTTTAECTGKTCQRAIVPGSGFTIGVCL